MRATFVGGPRHGTHEEMENPPERLMANNPDGTTLVYNKRSEQAEGVGNFPMRTFQVWYAPLNMSAEEFHKHQMDLLSAGGNFT